jgi:hypothetical protein
MFQLSPPDFLYSVYRPDLVAAGNSDGRPAVDGRPLSGLPQDNDDALSRRDMGLEFLDVTGDVQIELIDSNVQGDPDHREGDRPGGSQRQQDTYRITNNSASVVDTHLLMVARGLSFQVEMENASGRTSTGEPYLRVFLRNGVLQPGQSIVRTLRFKRHRNAPPVSYTLTLLSGQGSP